MEFPVTGYGTELTVFVSKVNTTTKVGSGVSWPTTSHSISRPSSKRVVRCQTVKYLERLLVDVSAVDAYVGYEVK
jgi:hypothetical protein